MGEQTQSGATLDSIARRLPSEVLDQKIYKAKVVFLGVDKKDAGYSKYKNFSANCHDYMVADGEISYLPEEALRALEDAVSYITKPANKKQEMDGIDGDNPRDKYEKVKDPRFDVTILDTMTIVIDENGVRTMKSDSQVSELELEETHKAIMKEERKRIEEEVRAEYEEKFTKMKADIPLIDEDKIDALLAAETEEPKKGK